MTGFGAAEKEINGVLYKAEIRAVNSKNLDINLKLPASLKHLDFIIRKHLSSLQRGKIDFNISVEGTTSSDSSTINTVVLQGYIDQIKSVAEKNQLQISDLLSGVLQLPGVIVDADTIPTECITEADIMPLIDNTLTSFNRYRADEGKALLSDLSERIHHILDRLAAIVPFEEERIQRIRERIWKDLKSIAPELHAEESRFETEILYYVEKLDINEEKVRLKAHCDYFLAVTEDAAEREKGKKLGFIAQEMGREVNTIGSKANHAGIQQQVVAMKEEIEKIKEQANNIL
jgi:uncharacterized protein (TIGR00255 family)